MSRFQGPNIVFKPGDPWPHYRLSDGTLLCYKGRVYVRSLIDLTQPYVIKANRRAMLVHNAPGHIALCKIGSGSYRYREVKEDAVEGVDFEFYNGKAEIDWNGE